MDEGARRRGALLAAGRLVTGLSPGGTALFEAKAVGYLDVVADKLSGHGDERFAEAYGTGWQLDAAAALIRTDSDRLRRTPDSVGSVRRC
jgi:hypothetical protein